MTYRDKAVDEPGNKGHIHASTPIFRRDLDLLPAGPRARPPAIVSVRCSDQHFVARPARGSSGEQIEIRGRKIGVEAWHVPFVPGLVDRFGRGTSSPMWDSRFARGSMRGAVPGEVGGVPLPSSSLCLRTCGTSCSAFHDAGAEIELRFVSWRIARIVTCDREKRPRPLGISRASPSVFGHRRVNGRIVLCTGCVEEIVRVGIVHHRDVATLRFPIRRAASRSPSSDRRDRRRRGSSRTPSRRSPCRAARACRASSRRNGPRSRHA